MKTKQLILLFVAVVVSTSVSATKTPRMNIIPLGDSKALVAVEQDGKASQQISITSEAGQTVYFKESDSPGFKQVFDLSELKDGTYTVKVSNSTASVKRNTEIQKGELTVKSPETEYVPVLITKDNILKVSYLNFSESNVSFAIYDNGNRLYNSVLGKEFAIQRGFDISKLERGTYDVLLATADEEYWFSVTK